MTLWRLSAEIKVFKIILAACSASVPLRVTFGGVIQVLKYFYYRDL